MVIKRSPNAWSIFLANVKSYTLHIKLQWLLFGQLLEKIGILYNLASGHPGRSQPTQKWHKNVNFLFQKVEIFNKTFEIIVQGKLVIFLSVLLAVLLAGLRRPSRQ